jgi:hypothetical protein
MYQLQNVKILNFYSARPNFTPINVRYKVFKIVFGGASTRRFEARRRDDAIRRFYVYERVSDSKSCPDRYAGLKVRKSLRNDLARPLGMPKLIAFLYCIVVGSFIFLRLSIVHISRVIICSIFLSLAVFFGVFFLIIFYAKNSEIASSSLSGIVIGLEGLSGG